jgi:hypothetical protein
MQELLFFALLFLSVVVWPIWLFRRMRKVREMTSGPDRDVAERRQAMPWQPYTDEIKGEDGLTYARPMDTDPDQISAERSTAEMPDINKTLQGKR